MHSADLCPEPSAELDVYVEGLVMGCIETDFSKKYYKKAISKHRNDVSVEQCREATNGWFPPRRARCFQTKKASIRLRDIFRYLTRFTNFCTAPNVDNFFHKTYAPKYQQLTPNISYLFAKFGKFDKYKQLYEL